MSYDSPMSQQEKVGPPSSHVLETEIDGDISLYHPQTEQVTVLNPTASDVWRLADGESNIEEIAGLLAAAYGVDREEIAGEVAATVRSFEELGLIESA